MKTETEIPGQGEFLSKITTISQLQEFVEKERKSAEESSRAGSKPILLPNFRITKITPLNYPEILLKILHLNHERIRKFDKLRDIPIHGNLKIIQEAKNILMGWLEDERGDKWCPNCNRKLPTEKFKLHLRRTHIYQRPIFTTVSECGLCEKIFLSKGELDVHIRKCHTTETPFKCSDCNSTFITEAYLKIHVNIKHTKGKTYPCHVCGREDFYSSSARHKHIQHHHSYKTFPCSEPNCGKSFKDKGILNFHQRERHRENNSAVDCEICGKHFDEKNAYKLKYHIKTHSPSIMSKCPFCGKELSTNIGLKMHMAVHTKEKAFKCSDCGKRFFTLPSLYLHNRSHENKRKYNCDLCDVNFNLGHHLRNHLKSQIHIDAKRIFDLA